MLVRRGHALNGSEVFRATAQRSLELAELLKLTSKVLVVAFMVEKKLIGQVKRGDSGIERPEGSLDRLSIRHSFGQQS
jgi:hypothetical protein